MKKGNSLEGLLNIVKGYIKKHAAKSTEGHITAGFEQVTLDKSAIKAIVETVVGEYYVDLSWRDTDKVLSEAIASFNTEYYLFVNNRGRTHHRFRLAAANLCSAIIYGIVLDYKSLDSAIAEIHGIFNTRVNSIDYCNLSAITNTITADLKGLDTFLSVLDTVWVCYEDLHNYITALVALHVVKANASFKTDRMSTLVHDSVAVDNYFKLRLANDFVTAVSGFEGIVPAVFNNGQNK